MTSQVIQETELHFVENHLTVLIVYCMLYVHLSLLQLSATTMTPIIFIHVTATVACTLRTFGVKLHTCEGHVY